MHRVLLDTDLAMGAEGSDIDDGFALALAVAEPEIRLELVTTVHGNTDVDTATALSAGMLDRLGAAGIPVVRGAAHRLHGAQQARAAPRVADSHKAAVEIVERVLAEPGELTIVAIGPLTNVALALALEPRVATAVQQIVIMGGCYLGHTNIAAMPGEFNIWADPDAAAIVFACGAPLRCVGLDVTRQVRLTKDDADALAARGTDFGTFAGRCAIAWIGHNERNHPGDPAEQGAFPMHDALAVAALTKPDLLTWREAHVAVERSSRLTRGITVADLGTSAEPPEANCEIAVEVDVAGFAEHFRNRVGSL